MRDEDYLNRLRALSNQQNVPLRVKPAETPQIPQQYSPTFNKPTIKSTPQPQRQVSPYSFPQQAQSYIAGAGSQLGGGLLRLGLRAVPTAARFTPMGAASFISGKLGGRDIVGEAQRKGEELARESERRQAAEIARQPDQAAARRGMQFGSLLKGTAEAGLMITPVGAASRAIQGTKLFQAGIKARPAISLATRVGENILSGTPATVIGILQEVGRGNKPNVAKEALIGSAIDALIPVVGKGYNALKSPQVRNILTGITDKFTVKGVIKSLDETLPEKAVEDAAESIAKSTNPEEIGRIIDDISVEPVRTTVPEVPSIPTPTAPVSAAISQTVDATARELSRTTEPATVKLAIDALFPNLDEATRTNLSNTIARTTDPETVKTSLEQAQKRSDELSATIAQETPPVQTETQRQAEAAARLVEQPPVVQAAPRPVTEAPTVTPTPSTVQGATFETVAEPAPLKANIAQDIAAQAEASKELYQARTIPQKLKSIYDPKYRALQIDRAFADSIDAKFRNLAKTESLYAMLQKASNYATQTTNYLKDSPIANVIQRYGAKGASSQDFNTYRLFMRDLEQRADGRDALFRQFTPEQMLDWVKKYEANNPQAREDLIALSKSINDVQDLATNAGTVSQVDILTARTKQDGTPYQYWTPVQRALPEEKAGIVVNAQNLGTIGQQRILQEFQGSDIPLDPTFESVTDYIRNAFRQIEQTKVVQKYAERVEQGLIPAAKFVQTGEEAARLKQLQGTFKELGDIKDSLVKELRKVRTKARLAAKDLTIAEKQMGIATEKQAGNIHFANKEVNRRFRDAITKAKGVIKGMIDPNNVDEIAALDSLTDQELVDLLSVEIQPELYSKGAKGAAQIRALTGATKKLSKAQETTKQQLKAIERIKGKSAAHTQLVENLQDMRMNLESISNARKGVGREMVELRPDPTTGRQVINGLDGNGNKFKIEVPPEDAILLQGLDIEQINSTLKAVKAAQRPIREFFTGVLNPSFQISQAAFNTMMLPIVSDQGVRTLGPRAVKAAFKSFTGSDEFTKLLRSNGANVFGGGLEKLATDTTAEALAAQADVLTKLKWFSNPKRAFEQLSVAGGKLDQAARTAAGQAAFDARIRLDGTPEEALADAVYAYNNVLPDFANLSSFVRGMDALVMYTGASQAGTRTFLRAIRNNPVKVSARLSTAAAVMGGLAGYNLSQDKGEEFYQDMIDSKKEYILDTNFIIVTPGAKKDKKTGEWTGIIKIPVAPELRPLNAAVRNTMYDNTSGAPLKVYARSVFDMLSGQMRTATNPLVEIYSGLKSGVDPRYGTPFRDVTMTDEEKRNANIKFILNNVGLPGQIATAQMTKQPGAQRFTDSLVNKVYGAKGLSDAGRWFKDEDDSIKEVGLDINELNAYKSIISPRSKDLSGNQIKPDTYFDSAAKAEAWLMYPDAFKVSQLVDKKGRERGNPGNPLFDLPNELVVKVLQKMALPPGAKDPELSNLWQQDWYQDYTNKRNEYYSQVQQILAKEGKELPANTNPYPVPSTELQQVMSIYSALPKGTGARSQWIRSNPQLWQKMTEQWAAVDAWENRERVARGLAPIEPTTTQQFGGGFGFKPVNPAYKEALAAINNLPTQFKPLSIVSAAPRRVRLQRQRVPTTRRAARIRLR